MNPIPAILRVTQLRCVVERLDRIFPGGKPKNGDWLHRPKPHGSCESRGTARRRVDGVAWKV